MRTIITSGLTALIIATIIACGSSNSDSDDLENAPPTSSSALSAPTNKRDWLTAAHLNEPDYPHSSPIHNSYFLPIGNTSAELHKFSGRIQINSRRLLGNFSEYYIGGDESFKNFPDISLEFISDSGKLIPLHRDRQLKADDNSFWGVILDPGLVWSEDSDDGWSRASFPISFISARRNQVHNGVASFIYNDSQMSHLRVQFTQETTSWFRNDIYAHLDASYQPKTFSNESQIIEAFKQEESNTVTIHPWSTLTNLSQTIKTSQFNSNLPQSSISATGIIIDGEVYAQPCYTRYGNYPFCRWMRNGAYSVTKSLGASLTMMRLAQKYGEQVYQLKVIDYLNVTAPHSGWDSVTFGDVLNMAVGVGDNGDSLNSGDIFADENTAKMESWLVKPSLAEKLEISFSYRNYSWGPGEVFRYNSAMTIVLAAAMNAYYQSIEGAEFNIWQMMRDEVFTPLGIQHVPILATDEPSEQPGLPELFHGLYPNIDDLAKLTMLLQNNGSHNGEQILHQGKLLESLFQTSNIGLHSWWEDNEYGESRYLYSFWTSPYSDNNGCNLQLPYMSGFGGNIVVVLPNNVSLFRFADADSYSPFNMIQASVSERTICP
ncbi:serine hydrolase domain-containing protein [Aliikangiella sp. G2MR2-5]|uniref:serine hydrolase n=1 Tax=Aliikangiella sp. G2MR2-5 TaxID=2788943 RepID=UPI0018A9CC60|nr:serine hydrolase domain-containing protein [Aliikangiella sp. G2MR2-5]